MTAAEGWEPCGSQEGFSELAGPYVQRRERGRWVRAFQAEARHSNPEGFVHGGALMSFADFVCYRAALDDLGEGSLVPTVTLTVNFLAAAKRGDLVLGHGTVTRRTRSLVFTEARLEVAGEPMLTASGVYKIVKAPG